MACQCAGLHDGFYLEDSPTGFKEALRHEGTGNWIDLYSCPDCGALWVIDALDKLQRRLVFRTSCRENWDVGERIEERKEALLRGSGGPTDEPCTWSGCEARRVKDRVFCIDHLWDMGIR